VDTLPLCSGLDRTRPIRSIFISTTDYTARLTIIGFVSEAISLRAAGLVHIDLMHEDETESERKSGRQSHSRGARRSMPREWRGHVINYAKRSDWDEEVLSLTGGLGLDLAVDVGGRRPSARRCGRPATAAACPSWAC
jgi:hypothetical protein